MFDFNSIVGWVGSTLFAVCAVPQAYQSWKDKHSFGMSWGFLLCWALGEALTTLYILPKRDWPLLFNYTFNLACLAVIIYYKASPNGRQS